MFRPVGVEPPKPPSLAEVVGKNAKKLRGEISGDRLASAARKRGLNWGTGRVADLEAGRVSPTLPTLIALALALGDIRGAPIKLADLVESDEFVSVTDDLVLSGEALIHFVTGWPVQAVLRYIPGGPAKLDQLLEKLETARNEAGVGRTALAAVEQSSGEAEYRASKALGVDAREITFASAHLWGRSLSDERDARAGADATAQKRGRITRQLYEELKVVIDDGDG